MAVHDRLPCSGPAVHAHVEVLNVLVLSEQPLQDKGFF
jgi:hypothetical protein